MATFEEQRKAEKIHEKAREYRGRFLNTVACIEREMGFLITELFCRQELELQKFFFSNLVMNLTLQKKKEIVFRFCKQYEPGFWEDEKEFLTKLDDVQTFRNKLAHSVVDVSENALNRPIKEGVGFVQWKGGEPLTDQSFYEMNALASTIHSSLSDLRRLLSFAQSYEKFSD